MAVDGFHLQIAPKRERDQDVDDAAEVHGYKDSVGEMINTVVVQNGTAEKRTKLFSRVHYTHPFPRVQ